MSLFLVFIAALILSLIIHPAAIRLSRELNFLDNPHRDRIHKDPTPVLGGLAMCISIFIVMMTARIIGIYEWTRVSDGLLVGGGLIALVGFIDDRFGMNPSIKLAGQFISAGMFVIFTEATIGVFHPLIEFGALIFGLVAMMNAFNILDNMDGVTGGMSFAIGLAFMVVAILSGDYNVALVLAAVLGAIAGFLRYNLPRARIFMGDAGAMFLGFIFGAFAIIYMVDHRSYFLYTTPFLILSYPIFDIALVSLSRMREKRSLSVAAPDSSPYRFVRWVFSTKNAYLAVFFINLIMGAFGVATFILRDNPVSVILIFVAGLSLSVLGVHLYRNFLYFIERTILFMVDLVSINAAFYFLYALKYKWGIMGYEIFIPYAEMYAPAVWISLFWVLLFSVLGLYEIRANRKFSDYIKALVKVVFAGMVAFLAVVVLFEGRIEISVKPVLFYIVVLVIFNAIFKYISFMAIRVLSVKKFKKPRAVLFVKGIDIGLDEMLKTARERFTLVGYVGELEQKLEDAGLLYLGQSGSLNNIIQKNRVEKIILVWPKDDYDNFMPIMQSHFYLENEFLVIGEPPPIFDGFRIIPLSRAGLKKISVELLRTWEWMFKRAQDIFISLILLILTSPVFAIRYVLSKLQNKPFLVNGEFYGRDGKKRECHYFYGTNEIGSGNGRLSPALPSLITVLKGDLSLVGTVPLTPDEAKAQERKLAGFWRRNLIKPGIWGPAHFHDESSYFDYELKYMKHMSILTDIYWILVGPLRCMFAMGKRKNVGSEIY
jgi:UDP-GlcNAc:undecaprenyl-phosphate GlcNAc-1-phosphate transferase